VAAARKRCAWAKNPLSIAYHDREWGVPVRDDRKLFEFLLLEGAQAGLSWDTILRKREHYREVFDAFDPQKVARYVWAFVGGKPLRNRRARDAPVAARSEVSDALSKDLKRRGFKFVGSTIMYAFMQAVGMVDDHAVGCFRRRAVPRR
jgi:DNA-3-methyladenine glycosylase I